MRKLLLLAAFCLLLLQAWSQNRLVRGTITSDKGTPIENASVQLKGTSRGTRTDASGAFSLNVVGNTGTLVVSSIGYATQEIALGSNSNYSLSLSATAGNLDEVVVTAYGSTRKQSFTGTASTISNDKFKDLQVSTITGILQGQASGVIAVANGGQPGDNPTIRVRGIGSVNASSDPLIVVDGAVYGGNINSINPDDIENVTVLKDASSTALYGSRAANGVIQITTKVGKGNPKINFNLRNGWSTRAVDDYNYVSSQQLYEYTWEALRNQAQITPNLVSSTGSASAEDYASKTVAGLLVYNPYNTAQPIGTDGKLKSGLNPLWNENWGNDLTQVGKRKEATVNASGGNDRTRYFLSGSYLDDQGLAIRSRFKRYTGRIKIDSKVTDWLSVGINSNFAYSTQNYPSQSGSAYNNVIGWIRGASSIYPEYLLDPTTGALILDANGNKQYDFGNNGPLVRPYGKGSNPAATTDLNPTDYTRTIASLNGFAEAQIINGLKIRSQYALDYYMINTDTYYNPFVGDGAAYGGRSYKVRETSPVQTWTNTLTYDHTFARDHHLNVVIGQEAYKYHDEQVIAEARGFSFPAVTELSYGSTPYTTSSGTYDNRLASYFARLNYDLYDKYHISGSIRTDGSSRFADSVRYGTFFSVGAAWNINREAFLQDVTWVNDLKLRASYGTTGNQTLSGYFPYLGTYSAGANIAGYSGAIISTLANGKLTWETQKTLDLGVDFSLFKNRLSGSVTYFTRSSSNLLFNRPLPPSVGISGINDNVGKIRNRGVEIDLTYRAVANRNFQWTISVNASRITNRILELNQPSIAGSNFSNLIVGESLNNFYIREYAGVDVADGRPTWFIDRTDASGKVTKDTTHTYSAATRYYKGNSLPAWSGGITNTLRYREFDLTILVSASLGGKIYDGNRASLMYAVTGTTPGSNWTTDIAGRWQSTSNTGDGMTPKLTSTTDYQGNSSSTRFLYDASYARVRNVTLGYNFPGSLTGKAKMTTLRLYVDAENLFTFFKPKGLDPEEGGFVGVTSQGTVQYRTISVGLNFGF